MRLGLVSATYPYGSKEPYLDTELRALAPLVDALTVFPAAPQSAQLGFRDVPGTVVRMPLLGAATLLAAARALLRHPGRVAAVVRTLLFERYPWRVKLKNLAVLPKGLALSEVARRRRLEHLHAYWLSTPATVAWIAAQVARIPFSATAHRWDIYEDNLASRKLRDATFVRTISRRGRSDLLARTGADPAKVAVVRLGVALPALDRGPPPVEPATGIAAGPLRILSAAALVPVKGHAVLLEALASLDVLGVDFACTLAGDGPLRADLQRRIDAAGLNARVRLAGTIPHDELLASLERGDYDVSVLASIEAAGGLMEGVPVALVEAMAAGVVVVATDSGSIGELVDGTTGLLVPHSNPPALAAALARFAREPDLRARLRGAARERVGADFALDRTIGHLRALLGPMGKTQTV